MPSLQIEPLPHRTGPGAVLAFVCDGTKLDRKHIGRIVLMGRTATVEVPTEKLISIVAALDGTAFSGKPVRVRATGGAIPLQHFETLAKLLDLEAEAEREALQRAAKADAIDFDGTVLTKLTLAETEYGLGGRLLLSFTSGVRLVPNRLQPGSPVLVQPLASHRRMPSYKGVVYDRDFSSIGVAIEPPEEDLPEEMLWRIDLAADEASRLRQQEALRRVAAADDDRLADLRAVLLGEREAEWNDEPAAESHLNDSQREAVRFALSAKDAAIIHGPPGTGKTTTVVELIRQAVARGERVLACAPSNHAVDNLLAKLLAAGEEPVRLGHPARVDEKLRGRALDLLVEKHADARQGRQYVKEANALFRQADKWTKEKPLPGEKQSLRREARALLKEATLFEVQAREKILDDARILCGTLTGLSSDVLGRRQFDLAVIDEACQATEPAAWLPILRASKVVLAGDHCQLPPTVLSPSAAKQGLSRSLMERLASMRPDLAKLLTVQYRMHESIMAFSNAEFYGGQLIAHESVANHHFEGVPPLRFIDTAGASYEEELEEESGSRRNPQEAALAVRFARELLASGVPAADIGIITPYRAQVRLLRDLLREVPNLEIDSVDGFQGREKEAIIVSLVRSNVEGEIGFLKDTRRTNVAFTRARRALLVIGDGATLAAESFYARMMEAFEALGAVESVWTLI